MCWIYDDLLESMLGLPAGAAMCLTLAIEIETAAFAFHALRLATYS